MSEIVGQWDAEFIDVDQELLFELILTANYMDIKPLLDLACAKVCQHTHTHTSPIRTSLTPGVTDLVTGADACVRVYIPHSLSVCACVCVCVPS
jgi:hypothetical protein